MNHSETGNDDPLKWLAYPLLTSDLASTAGRSSSASAASGTAMLQRTVDSALRQTLGRIPKVNDPRSFLAALNQSFVMHEVEGRVEISWTPRVYAGQSELGAGVTGAQASLFTRGTVTLAQTLPLLDILYPLNPEADPQLVSAARALVASDLREVVGELGMEGGPRPARVDTLFDSLFGHLRDLKKVFGLKAKQVNTLDEEANYSNFVALKDYVDSLHTSWNKFKKGGKRQDLGTSLVLLSRALSVTAETVDEIYAAMDSVFVGPAERQVAVFTFKEDDKKFPVRVEDFLSWVATFASDEAPRLVYEGGKRGAAAIVPTVNKLKDLADAFLKDPGDDPSNLPKALKHPRVLNPLEELGGYLGQVLNSALDVAGLNTSETSPSTQSAD